MRKAYKLSNWVLHTLSGANNEYVWFLLLSRHSNLPIFDLMLTRDENWILCNMGSMVSMQDTCFYRQDIAQLQARWQNVIDDDGDYFKY